MSLKGLTALHCSTMVGLARFGKTAQQHQHKKMLSVKSKKLEVSPTARWSCLPKITQEVLNTHVQHTVNTIEVETPKNIKKTVLRRNPSSRGHSSRRTWISDTYLLEFVCDAVMAGQSQYELEGDGWHADDIHEAVCTWCDMEAPSRSQAHGLSPAHADLLSRIPLSIASAASWRFRDWSQPSALCHQLWEVFYARSDVAHADPSPLVVMCHT